MSITSKRHTPSVSVYVVEEADRDCVKIGVAADPEKRLRHLQVANSDMLVLHAVYPLPSREEARRVEAAVHKALAVSHIHGEWFFLPVKSVLAAVADAITEGA